MTYGLHQAIPGGSEYHIEFDGPKQKEVITVYLPPVGYTIDRMPDPDTGVPSYQLVKCEILGDDLPLEQKKWKKSVLPKNWDEWRNEEKRQQRFTPEWVHPEAEKFRAQEWTRRVNGVWQALGNRNGKPTEYVYIPGCAYYYFTWWEPDFGFPTFRKVYLKTFYALQWAEDHPKVNGIVLSTYRRHGKTSIAGCWTVDQPSRMQFGYAGMQAQAGKKALEFFDIHLMQPFRRMVDFFQPKYDPQASQKSQLLFLDPPPKSQKSKALQFDDKRKPLGGRINCVTSSETSLDGKKQHRIWLDECFAPGTKILCEGFVFRNIEDIRVGDKVIVEGGKSVEVAATQHGYDEMFRIHQPYGKDYLVNSQHKIILEYRPRVEGLPPDHIINCTADDYFGFGKYKQRTVYRVTSKGLNFTKRTHAIPPYLFGLWLGDGRYNEMTIIVNIVDDIEIYNYLRDYALDNNINFIERRTDSEKCKYIKLKSLAIDFKYVLKSLNVYKNKHIPKKYLLDSYENRLDLLAGIIDTDGHATDDGSIQIAMANKRLIQDIHDLAGSLGFSVSQVTTKKTNFNSEAYRVSISGDLEKIPCRIERKKNQGYKKQYVSRRDRIEIKREGSGEYYGITLKTTCDSERQMILEDFTLVHNCGKWEKVDILKTVTTYVPCTVDDLRRKIGLIFMPSTVEEMGKGGQEFVDVFEKSVPSLMQKNKNGKTSTALVSVFIPAYEGVIFDEYGRSVVSDPKPGEICLDEAGRQITEGAKTFLKAERDSKETDEDKIMEVRKYPWSWFEAKMSTAADCQFNAGIITKRLEELRAMPALPFIRGNFEWVDEVDGDVEFVRDDISGRFQVAWLPDHQGGQYENSRKIINNVRAEYEDGKWYYYPLNDRLFAAGGDPIAYKSKTKGVNARLSKGGAHIFRKYDPHVDQGKPKELWESYNFVCQYLSRPDDFETYAEDQIKMVRFWGCSINAEDNVQALRMYFDQRGYGGFIMYRRDLADVLTQPKGMATVTQDAPVRSNEEVISTYTRILNTFINRHGNRIMFPELLEQCLQFDPSDTQKSDAVVSAGYALIGSEKKDYTDDESESSNVFNYFQAFDISGNRSKPIAV